MVAQKLIDLQKGKCQTTFDYMFDILSIFVKDVHGILTFLCSYEDEIMIGSALVGFPEAIPVEATVCKLNDGTEVAANIIETAMIIVKSY